MSPGRSSRSSASVWVAVSAILLLFLGVAWQSVAEAAKGDGSALSDAPSWATYDSGAFGKPSPFDGVSSGAALAITKLAAPVEPVPATWDIHYTVLITNTGDVTCTNVVVTDTKDARTWYKESTPMYDNLIGSHVFVWYIGELQPGEHRTILLRIITTPSLAQQVVHNEAAVDSDQTAPVIAVRDTQMGRMPLTATPLPTVTASPTPTASPTATSTPGRTVRLRLEPADTIVDVGEVFGLSIWADAGMQPIHGAQVHLNVDPQRLQVVDAGGSPASSIQNSGVLDVLLLNTVDNEAGEIDFAAGVLQGDLPSGTFEVARMFLKALTDGAGADAMVLFSDESPRRTDVTYAGVSVLESVTGAAVHIVQASPSATATVTLSPRILLLPIIVRGGL